MTKGKNTEPGVSSRCFYDRVYAGDDYANLGDEHPFKEPLERFLDNYSLREARCLELGSGRGVFQNMVSNYTGVDLSQTVARYYEKPFLVCSGARLPFKDNSFDALWSYAVLEHIPEPEEVLQECRRVLRDGALLLLAPAWQCRSWAAEGYPVRPYRDFGPRGKIIKASIPLRNSVWYRSLSIFPRRLWRTGVWRARSQPVRFAYRRLRPNFEHFWMPDSDAINSMDPYDAIVWFVSRGDACLNYPTLARQFLVRTGAIVIRIQKGAQDMADNRTPRVPALGRGQVA